MEPISVQPLFEQIKILMQPELTGKKIELAVEVTDQSSPVNMDLKLIEQVLINLITNSIHALRKAEHPKIKLIYTESDNKKIIAVEDNGEGIPEKELRDIFVPFFTTRKDGSGIGLSLSKQIVAQHGGSLRVYSQLNEFTKFEMVLPG